MVLYSSEERALFTKLLTQFTPKVIIALYILYIMKPNNSIYWIYSGDKYKFSILAIKIKR